MKRLINEMNGLNELVYVADPGTYELLFLNTRGLNAYGYTNMNQVAGRKCYEVLQGKTEPCSFCTNARLSAGSYYEWTKDNPLTGGHYLLKDKLIDWDGKAVRMEIALDVTQSVHEKEMLQKTLDRERVVLECIRMMHSSDEADVAIQNTLRVMGEYLHSERTYIFEIYGSRMDNTYEWCAPGVSAEIANLKDVPLSIIGRWMEAFEKGECVVITDLENVRESSPDEYARLAPQQISSLITVPLMENDEVFGFFGVDNPPAEELENVTAILNILAYFFQSLLSNRRMSQRLKQLSFMDGLTGAMNRNAFIRDIAYMPRSREPGNGVIFIDVNGLKETNDKYGHVAGDELLMSTFQLISAVFGENSKYRTGGDEFVVLCSNMKREEFLDRAGRLRKMLQNEKEQMASLGIRWAGPGEDMQQAVNEAETLMYLDKKVFYEALPEKREPRHNRLVEKEKPEGDQGTADAILEEAQIREVAAEMLRIFFERGNTSRILQYLDTSCVWMDEVHPQIYGYVEVAEYFEKRERSFRELRIQNLEQYVRKISEDIWLCCDWCDLTGNSETGKQLRIPFKDSKLYKRGKNGYRCYFAHTSMIPGEEETKTY